MSWILGTIKLKKGVRSAEEWQKHQPRSSSSTEAHRAATGEAETKFNAIFARLLASFTTANEDGNIAQYRELLLQVHSIINFRSVLVQRSRGRREPE